MRGALVIEGVRLVEEAFRAGIMPALVFYSEGVDAIPGGRELLVEMQKGGSPTNPKVVRGAIVAHFRLPVEALSWPEIAEALTGVQVLLAAVRAERAYCEADWTPSLALIIGGEAQEASRGARELAATTIAIPMHGGVESLNAAVAASVILFEAARQRRRL